MKPLGCLSFTGILAILVTLLLIGGAGIARGGVMFSPGDLNAETGQMPVGGVFSHAETAGHCAACHTAPWDARSMDDRCLACHTNLIQDSDNFHRVMLAEGQRSTCRACHTDHRGPEASLTVLAIDRFPHQAVGFSLRAHEKMAVGSAFHCSDCHANGFTLFDAATCSACHQKLDPVFSRAHREAFGEDCLACHDGVDSYGRAFDHNQAVFPLLGRHAPLACADCHAGARSIIGLKSAPQKCSACHAKDDAHQGQFGQDCAGCHTPVDWKQATFDHSLAAFPLVGNHSEVACQDCHGNNVFKGTPQDCIACHAKDDVHQGQFGPDCAGCHTPEDWKQASFDHSKSTFPLTGAHFDLECSQCHRDEAVFRGTPTECATCHAEPAYHQGLFAAACETCHTTAAWSPARFDEAHPFPIYHGEGGPNTCRTCHSDSLQTYTCYGCHEHNPDRIADKHREEGISDFQNCVRCHPAGQEEGEGGGEGGEEGGD